MRRFSLELVRREHQYWVAMEPEDGELLADALRRLEPDVLVVDDGDFPACCRPAIEAFPPSRVVVVGLLVACAVVAVTDARTWKTVEWDIARLVRANDARSGPRT